MTQTEHDRISVGWEIAASIPGIDAEEGVGGGIIFGYLTSDTTHASGSEVNAGVTVDRCAEIELAVEVRHYVLPNADFETIAQAVGGVAVALEIVNVNTQAVMARLLDAVGHQLRAGDRDLAACGRRLLLVAGIRSGAAAPHSDRVAVAGSKALRCALTVELRAALGSADASGWVGGAAEVVVSGRRDGDRGVPLSGFAHSADLISGHLPQIVVVFTFAASVVEARRPAIADLG